MPHIKPFLPFIASSRLGDSVWSEEHNAFMFVERAWAQPKEMILKMTTLKHGGLGGTKAVRPGGVNRKQSNRVTTMLLYFDLATVNITDYVNPMSGYMKLWQLRSDLWQEVVSGSCQCIYLLHPPRLVSLLWKIARLFLTE
ncbi:hypothetical protein OSTOST_24718, partial [Ostertagia ostertagi]